MIMVLASITGLVLFSMTFMTFNTKYVYLSLLPVKSFFNKNICFKILIALFSYSKE